METIILMVLLAVASSIFQSAVQKNKRQKDIIQNSAPIRESRPKVSNMKVSNMKVEPEAVEGDLQTNVINNLAIPQQKDESTSVEYTGLLQEITINDLQRSIIMSEVLGKPKALRRTSR